MTIKIVHENVEKTLIDTIHLCQKMNIPLRCIYLGFSNFIHASPELWQPAVLTSIEQSLNLDEKESILYVCGDGDMMLLSRKLSRKNFLHLLDLLPRNYVPDPNIPGLVQLFELNIDGGSIALICQEKIDAHNREFLNAERKKETEKAAIRKNHERDIELDIALNSHLISSLLDRRVERKVPGILIVEDDLFSQRLVTNALRNSYEIYTATNGREALSKLIKNAPDMIFLDIDLPDLTGLEILHEILRIDPKSHIVMLSGNGSRENVVTAIEKGAKGFIGKPFTLEKLQQAIDKCNSINQKRPQKGNTHA